MEQSTNNQELKNTSYELFILLVSVLSLINLLLLILPGINQVLKDVVRVIDLILSFIFVGDFLYRLFTAESKFNYFVKQWGWADLLASIPAQQLKIFRVFRVIRVIRLLQQYGLRNMLLEIRNNRAGSALYITVFLVILVLEFAGTAIVYVEYDYPGANITSASDAIWWSFVTITTVGYGDQYPVSGTGRIIGMIVMMLGVGLFGVLTGFLANAFLAPGENEDNKNAEPLLGDPGSQIADFRRLLLEQEKVNQALQAKLSAIEAHLEANSTF